MKKIKIRITNSFKKAIIEEKEIYFSKSTEEGEIKDSDDNKKIMNGKEKYDYLNNIISISNYENTNEINNIINKILILMIK